MIFLHKNIRNLKHLQKALQQTNVYSRGVLNLLRGNKMFFMKAIDTSEGYMYQIVLSNGMSK